MTSGGPPGLETSGVSQRLRSTAAVLLRESGLSGVKVAAATPRAEAETTDWTALLKPRPRGPP